MMTMKPGPRNINLQEHTISPEELEKSRLQWEENKRKMAEAQKKRELVHDVLTQLQIPHNADNTVLGEELATILMDQEKIKDILTRVRNKAFWW